MNAMETTRIFDLLKRYEQNFDKPDALVSKKNGEWTPVSSKEYIEQSHLFAYGLLSKGFKKGDKIASITHNCPEWNIIDMGMSMVGVVHVPIFNTLCQDEFRYIFEHSEVKAIFVSDAGIHKNCEPACAGFDCARLFHQSGTS